MNVRIAELHALFSLDNIYLTNLCNDSHTTIKSYTYMLKLLYVQGTQTPSMQENQIEI